MGDAALSRVIADRIRRRAAMIREWRTRELGRIAKDADLADVLDAVAMRVADGDLDPALAAGALRAVDPPPPDFGHESEATVLRRIFGLPGEMG